MLKYNNTNQSENSVQLVDRLSNTDYVKQLKENNDLITEINEIEVNRFYDLNINNNSIHEKSKSKYSINLDKKEDLINELKQSFDLEEDQEDAFSDIHHYLNDYDISLEHHDFETKITKTDFSNIEVFDKQALVNIWAELEKKYNKKYVLIDYMTFTKNKSSDENTLLLDKTRVLLNITLMSYYKTENELTLEEYKEKNSRFLSN